jgi:hypothetical protein
MHDRKDLRPPVEVLLALDVVGEEALHLGGLRIERGRRAGSDEGVQLSVGQHAGQSLLFTNGRILDVGWQVQLQLFDTAGFLLAARKMLHVGRLDAEVVG